MRRRAYAYRQGSSKGKFLLAAVLFLALIVIGFVSWKIYHETRVSEQPPAAQQDQENASPISEQETPEVVKPPAFDKQKLQAAVDSWSESTSGDAEVSVAILNLEGDILAGTNPDQVFFAASLYKLFVAYEGYRAIDSGEKDPKEMYLSGKTREECLDLMIRESDSPCAERMWVELGKEQLTEILKDYGIKNTSMVSISTSARDTALILARIKSAEGLSTSSKQKYLDSLKNQPAIYRRGLPSGFSSEVTVYNKVGWNELVEWHDSAIIDIDDRTIVVSVLTQRAGSSKVSELASQIEKALVR